jgi:hypothetical protein
MSCQKEMIDIDSHKIRLFELAIAEQRARVLHLQVSAMADVVGLASSWDRGVPNSKQLTSHEQIAR